MDLDGSSCVDQYDGIKLPLRIIIWGNTVAGRDIDWFLVIGATLATIDWIHIMDCYNNAAISYFIVYFLSAQLLCPYYSFF